MTGSEPTPWHALERAARRIRWRRDQTEQRIAQFLEPLTERERRIVEALAAGDQNEATRIAAEPDQLP